MKVPNQFSVMEEPVLPEFECFIQCWDGSHSIAVVTQRSKSFCSELLIYTDRLSANGLRFTLLIIQDRHDLAKVYCWLCYRIILRGRSAKPSKLPVLLLLVVEILRLNT